MATLAEALALLLAKPQPPWGTQSLRGLFNSKSLSIRSVLTAVDARVVLLFIEVRPMSLLDGNPTLEQFLTRWAAPTAEDTGIDGKKLPADPWTPYPAQLDTIKSLQSIFQPLGVSIAYVSLDGGTIGIVGTYSSLLKIPAIIQKDPNASPGGQTQSGLSNLGQGLVGTGASFAALGAAGALLGAGSGLVAALLITGGFLGFLGVGLFLGVGIYQLAAGAATPATSSQVTTTTDPTQSTQTITITQFSIGLVPDNLHPMTVDDLLEYFNEHGEFPELVEPGQLPDDGDDGDDDDQDPDEDSDETGE